MPHGASSNMPREYSRESSTKSSTTDQSGSQKRKRTKTGCLTCRKRRIKCDEGQPQCLNCVKSRRSCEGYKIPLVFRSTATSPFRPKDSYGSNSTVMDPFSYDVLHATGATAYGHGLHTLSYGDPPRQGQHCAMNCSFSEIDPSIILPPDSDTPFSFDECDSGYFPSPSSPQIEACNEMASYIDQIQPHPGQTGYNNAMAPLPDSEYCWAYDLISTNQSTDQRASLISRHDIFRPTRSPGITHTVCDQNPSRDVYPSSNAPFVYYHTASEYHSLAPYISSRSTPQTIQALPAWEPPPSTHDQHVPIHPVMRGVGVGVRGTRYGDDDNAEQSHPNLEKLESIGLFDTRRRSVLATNPGATLLASLDMTLFTARTDAHPTLDDYTRAIFKYFVSTTGAMITGYDRSSPFDAAISDQHQLPFAFPGLFTSDLPTVALHNPGLLQAILAMGSLQIAKLSGSSTTPSLKHYVHSLRRVHNAVRDDTKRHEVGTLATTLLLAYYEVATADHIRWNTHLAGATQLIKEIDFAGMTRQFRLMRAKALHVQSRPPPDRARHSFLNKLSDLDLPLLSKLVGRPLGIEKNGYLMGDQRPHGLGRHFSLAELYDYEVMRDLYWWYIRQDTIHGLVGGTKLLLDYENWTDCPPRAPIGIPTAHYGTSDHLLLIFGRLVRFIARDRPRKINVQGLQQHSTQPGEPRGKTSSHTPALAHAQPKPLGKSFKGPFAVFNPEGSAAPTRSEPAFYGMSPNCHDTLMPRAFNTSAPPPTAAPAPQEDSELSVATAQAWDEWNAIRAAFAAFAAALGPEYHPLPDSAHRPTPTPFGSAHHYRSTGIACVAAWYHMGLIVALRSQPSMPPAATMAVGAAAPQTVQLANTVGRIIGGVRPDLTTRPLRPIDAGGMSDCFVPLFFAAVQFREPEQRGWTIDWLLRVEKLTGWASVGLCANGCESSWVRAAEAGRGLEYHRVMGIKVDGPMEGESGDQEEAATSGNEENADAERKESGDKKSVKIAVKAEEEGERGFLPFRRGNQTMWAYTLYSTTTEELGKLSLGKEQG